MARRFRGADLSKQAEALLFKSPSMEVIGSTNLRTEMRPLVLGRSSHALWLGHSAKAGRIPNLTQEKNDQMTIQCEHLL